MDIDCHNDRYARRATAAALDKSGAHDKSGALDKSGGGGTLAKWSGALAKSSGALDKSDGGGALDQALPICAVMRIISKHMTSVTITARIHIARSE